MVTVLLAGVALATAQWPYTQPRPVNPYQNMIVNHIAQDSIGNFGYATADGQTRQQVVAADGSVRGSYSYPGANGIPVTVNYIADRQGYRTIGGAQALTQPAAPVQHAPVQYAAPQPIPYQHAPYATRPRVHHYNPVAEAQLAQTIQVHALRDQDAQRKQLQQLSAITGGAAGSIHSYNPHSTYASVYG